MSLDGKVAHFLMLGQAADRSVVQIDKLVPTESLLISSTHDLAVMVPDKVRRAIDASEPYRLFFVFENYLREFIVDVLSKENTEEWWDRVPKDVQDEVTRLEQTEEMKSWMSLGSRDKSALMTLPQLLKVIEEKKNWDEFFEEVVRDKSLIQEARLIVHLRNTICHMSVISAEEINRIRQTMRDWFRRVAP